MSCAKFYLKMSEHVGENCGKPHISYILSLKRGITPLKVTTLKLVLKYIKTKLYTKMSDQYLTVCRRKVRKTAKYLYSKFSKRHNAFKN